MSFLSSILSTIGDRPPAPAAATRGRPPTPGQSKPPAPKVSSANGTTTGQVAKRKAEGDIGGVPSKSQRRDDPVKNPDRPSSSIRTVATATSAKTQASSSSSTNPLPYRGTAREGSAPAATASATKPIPRPLPVASKSSLNPSQPSSRPTSKPTTPTSTAPLKRGSYQEILARAKAQQAQQSQVGVIKHKKVEQPVSKKERLAQQQAEAKNKSATGKDTKKPARAAEEAGGKSGEPAKERKKPADVGYHGTMRPSTAEPSYKGTMKPGAAGKGRASAYDSDRGRSYNGGYRGTAAAGRKDKGRAGGYGGYSDEEEEDDYYSDASSDMEAAAFDLEEEEMYSLRIARKEDEEAQREEDELKRKKEQRKKMLAKMAADNAKKRRY